MNLHNLVLATAIVAFGAAQYTLAFQAINDLVRRPRVRGGNKMTWAIAILCLPIAGALFYSWMGPTSFLHRRAPMPVTRSAAPRATRTVAPPTPRPENVTPLRPRRTATSTRPTGRRAGLTHSRAHSTATGSNRVRRTGS
ncbi:MAG TPA: PLD nuclease N-terminal domain-containing protein [Thermomicrobiales bacterium]|nr:PLD nuclease N-terminal domain-containing protein [Thermomicrobiales bacterium]